MAGSFAFKEAARKAGAIMLEPIMDVEVITPEEHMGDVIGDLNSRRGKISHLEPRANSTIIHANVPLARDVRLRDGAAVADQGSRELLDGTVELSRRCRRTFWRRFWTRTQPHRGQDSAKK